MKIIKWMIILTLLCLGLSGCAKTGDDLSNQMSETESNKESQNQQEESSTTEESTEIEEVDFTTLLEDMFSKRDSETDYNSKDAIVIRLKQDKTEASDKSVQIEGNTIYLTKEETYIISGTLENGRIVVQAEENAKLQLVFNGVDIHSENSAAIALIEGDKVFITLAEGTENRISGGSVIEEVEESKWDGAIYSKIDLTFNGSGTLEVQSTGGHGIVCKDDLVFTGGSYEITSDLHGIDVNDSIRIKAGTFAIKSGKDGLHCDSGFVYIAGGNFQIKATGKGIAAHTGMQLDGGIYVVDSTDDGLHSNTSININNGDYTIATQDDGVHGENTLTITDCNMVVSKSYEGLEAKEIYVKGGTFVLHTTDDGINASGGNDQSGFGGPGFGGGPGGFPGQGGPGQGGWPGGPGGMPGSGDSDGVIDLSGGNITIYAGGDGMDANGSLTISGGFIYVANPVAGDTSVLDSDKDPVITGGTFISTGSTTMMAQTFSEESTQGVIACTVGNQSAGTRVVVKDSEGKEVIAYDVEYACVLVIISTPDLIKGAEYTMTIGNASGTISAY